ncbi:hypothetical protein [Paraburkholderia sp.]|jgi:hypothetical protein|uniref:hypothetical protein n=1 Tax=Paraburkholderia sp. TaxID=1926495 RepID=UPI003C7BD3E5
MEKLAYERIDDVRVTYPYLFVYFLRDGQVFKMGHGHPFLQISVGDDRELAFTFHPTEEPVSLNAEHWQHILETARDFLPEALASGD